jgi:hypothetical protein
MATLDDRADKVVRDAIDAFLDGRLVPDFAGETVFETKNSRYRLLDGVVFAAPDPGLVGAELVGWLCESSRRCLVESAWQPGSRAVLVDRKQGRNIIVTSTTRLLHQEERGSGVYQGGSQKSHSDFRSWHPPAADAALPPLPQIPLPPLPPARSAPVHLPPRPIGPRPTPAAARPLPAPVPPPVRVPAPPQVPAALDPSAVKEVPRPEPDQAEWALTSAELEMVVEDDATDDSAPFELARPIDLEPVNSEPFPLVRPADAPPPSRR